MLESEAKMNDATYKEAIERRNKLLEYDSHSVMHSAIKDQTADWYELENNTWVSKEQRSFAKKIREMEDERKFEEEMSTYVSIGTGPEVVSIKAGQVKSYDQIAQDASEYINQLVLDNIHQNQDEDDIVHIKDNFKDIRIKSCQDLDDNSRELMRKLREDAELAEMEMIIQARKKNVHKPDTTDDIRAKLSDRLQTENPFTEFQKELEIAIKEQEEQAKKEERKRKKKEDSLKQDNLKEDSLKVAT
jgi:hypothetical protein